MNKFRSGLGIGILALVLTFAAAPSSAGEEETEILSVKRHSKTIEFFGLDTSERLAQTLIGDGVEDIKPEKSAMARSGGSIYWEKTREKIDPEGMRHVFYRQIYRPPIGAVSAASPVAALGAWLVGAEVGLHYDPDGILVYVFGTQFEDVAVTSTPIIGSATDAVKAADEAAAESPDSSAADPGMRSPEIVNYQMTNAKLLLHSTGIDNTFNYVWKVPAGGGSGLTYLATLDAETGDLISLSDGIAWSECSPYGNDQDSAVGIPQNTGPNSSRSIWATETSDRGAAYTHEAQKNSSSSNPQTPEIQIFMGTDSDGCDQTTGNQYYSLMPIKTISGDPKYDDYTTPDNVPGNSGTDAIYFTYKTMQTFDDLGRNGWDGSGGDAVVVVDSGCGGATDNAAMIYDGYPTYAPNPSVAVCELEDRTYTAAAAIDIIAHEWGHGVIFDENLWDRTTTDGAIFHEGWADIIGHIAERHSQSSGYGNEKADWRFGEDNWVYSAGQNLRRVDEDDQAGGFSLHADDPGTAGSEHAAGNRLGVAYYLMSEGGYNDVCGRLPNLDGCDVDVSGIGDWAAGKAFFRALTFYMTSSAGWNNFGNIVKTAAYFMYKDCPNDNAQFEQEAAVDAFKAVGYDPAACCIPCLP